MKRKNTIWSLVLALVMVLGVIAPLGALAAEPTETNTVTLHKLMMTKDELKAWDSKAIEEKGYNGSQNLDALKKLLDANHSAHEADGIFFAWQEKGKEDQGYIKGKLVDNVMTPVFEGDNLVFTKDLNDAFGGLTKNKAGIKFNTSKLKGEFIIQEIKEKSTYKPTEAEDKGKVIAGQKAVPVRITLPLVNKDGVVVDAHVYPKNTQEKPQIDKNFRKPKDAENKAVKDKDGNVVPEMKPVDGADDTKNDQTTIDKGAIYGDNNDKLKAKATAKIGDIVPYEVKTKIDAGTSYERLVWNDIMTNGLTFKKGSVEISATNGVTFEAADYELTQDDNGFRLEMKQSGLEKIKATTTPDGKDAVQKEVVITLTYSATINGTAKVDVSQKNNVTLEYGHKPGKEFKPHDVTPKDGELIVSKSFDGEGADKSKVNIVYRLLKTNTTTQKDELKASVSLNADTEKNSIIDLGNGITFVVDANDPFSGTFKGLGTDTNGWKIEERVAGYDPEYKTTDAAGNVIITNHKDNDNPPPLEPKTPEVVVGGKRFVKTSEDAAVKLQGAKFFVKNKEGQYLVAKFDDQKVAEQTDLNKKKKALDDAITAYNTRKKTDDESTLKKAVDDAQSEYNKAYKVANISYTWSAKGDKTKALTLVSDENGQFEITGLEYNKPNEQYYLEEQEAPVKNNIKYAKINDLIAFTVEKGSYKSDAQGIDFMVKGTVDGQGKRIINKTVDIPQTGGMGTVLFMVVGVALMGGAFIAMRKRSAEQA